MKSLVVKLLKSCVLGRMVYEPLHKLYRLYSVPHRRRMLQKRGTEVLAKISEVAKRRNLPIFLSDEVN